MHIDKNEIEITSIDLLLDYYNHKNDAEFIVISRPDEINRQECAFDFLCRDQNTNKEIAIEVMRLGKSQKRQEQVSLSRIFLNKIQKALGNSIAVPLVVSIFTNNVVLFSKNEIKKIADTIFLMIKNIEPGQEKVSKIEINSKEVSISCIRVQVEGKGVVHFQFLWGGQSYLSLMDFEAYFKNKIKKKNKQLQSYSSHLSFLVLYSTMETMTNSATAKEASVVDEFYTAYPGVCPKLINASFSLCVTKALQSLYKSHPHDFSHIDKIYMVFPVYRKVDSINFKMQQTGKCDFCGKEKIETRHCHRCGIEICFLCDLNMESSIFVEEKVCSSCAKK